MEKPFKKCQLFVKVEFYWKFWKCLASQNSIFDPKKKMEGHYLENYTTEHAETIWVVNSLFVFDLEGCNSKTVWDLSILFVEP